MERHVTRSRFLTINCKNPVIALNIRYFMAPALCINSFNIYFSACGQTISTSGLRQAPETCFSSSSSSEMRYDFTDRPILSDCNLSNVRPEIWAKSILCRCSDANRCCSRCNLPLGGLPEWDTHEIERLKREFRGIGGGLSAVCMQRCQQSKTQI